MPARPANDRRAARPHASAAAERPTRDRGAVRPHVHAAAERLAWVVAVALVVLGSRAVAYALSPAPEARALLDRAGGPALPLVAIVSIALGIAASSAVLWLAALGVNERRLLEPRARAPRLRAGVLLPRAGGLFAAAALAFAALESFVHWRAGLGWHGLECLLGPVHRDALPILAALSLLAGALATAAEHVLAWMRSTLARLRAACRRSRSGAYARPRPARAASRVSHRPPGARAPPFAVA
ncbi:hypothetical protein [Candidatus Solirubrobacter pratensis]|uniref:hypothetical protein n=1 Tax=Candidatus Solirubrobacter pratensis TaxID=1298857 RepID=UPI00047F1B54|nr:hypothetical protein [Candidatus Solirubrobacter pratensis]